LTEEIRGTIRTSSARRTQERLTNHTVKIGAYKDDTDELHWTTFSAWVPLPTDVAHEAGIYISLHNGASRTFSRITPEELQSLIDLLSEAQIHLVKSYEVASHIAIALKQLDLRVHDYLRKIDPANHPGVPNIVQ